MPAGQSVRSLSQRVSALCSCGVDRDLPDAFAFAVNPPDALAGGAGDVVDVEGDDLADPGTGVERDERERLIAWRGAGLDCSQVAELGAFVERSGCGGGDLDSSGARGFAARSEWRLITATHSLLKLHSHRIATAGP